MAASVLASTMSGHAASTKVARSQQSRSGIAEISCGRPGREGAGSGTPPGGQDPGAMQCRT